MDVQTEPAYTIENVRDLDVAFATSPLQQFTLRDADTLEVTETEVRVGLAAPPEAVVLNRAHIAWYSIRPRTIKRPVEAPMNKHRQALTVAFNAYVKGKGSKVYPVAIRCGEEVFAALLESTTNSEWVDCPNALSPPAYQQLAFKSARATLDPSLAPDAFVLG